MGLSDISIALPPEQSVIYSYHSGTLPTATLSSGTGVQLDLIRDVQAHTPVTFNPTAGASATCAVAISSDNATYFTLCTWTVPLGVVFDGSIYDIQAKVPVGWYLKLTVVNATIGTTSYY